MLRAIHTTTYNYSNPVSLCHSEVHLAPRATAHQRVVSHELLIDPRPDSSATRQDYFGNEVTYFAIDEPHQTLSITSTSVVDLHPAEPIHPGLTPPWEQVRDAVGRYETVDSFDALQFVFESPRIAIGPEFAAYAAPSFGAGRPLLEAAMSLCRRIHREFEYDQRATTVRTLVGEVLSSRRGVCQDFAHIMIAALRSLRLPARYVSGYLRSVGNSVGAEASHAWVSVFCPGFGWLDLDPTNDVMPSGGHVTIAWGRDYSDVSPVKGVALGGGEQTIGVSVEVLPEASTG
ncbi:MAG: transglutaminase family protein [Candidatus Binataceae bacterium]